MVCFTFLTDIDELILEGSAAECLHGFTFLTDIDELILRLCVVLSLLSFTFLTDIDELIHNVLDRCIVTVLLF